MKIICIGRNYAKHIEELENEKPESPVVFLKPDSAILPRKNPFFIPPFSDDVHYEVEVLVKINKVGKHIDAKFAHKYYDEVGLGIDFTARDVQAKCKEKGLPWEKAKAFDGSAVVGEFYPKEEFDLENLKFLCFRQWRINVSALYQMMVNKLTLYKKVNCFRTLLMFRQSYFLLLHKS